MLITQPCCCILMGFPDERVQVDALERHLLTGLSSNDYNGSFEDEVLHDASFAEMEDNFVKYQIAQWTLLSLLLIVAWEVGLLMLLYIPIRVYVCPGICMLMRLSLEETILDTTCCYLQDSLQSVFRVYSIRIENIGVRKPHSYDAKITGVAHPHDFRKHLLNTWMLKFSQKASSDDEQSTSLSSTASFSKMQALLQGAETLKIKTTSS